MQIPLAENPRHIALLCDALGIDSVATDLSRVFGGFHHKMWWLDTGTGSYAIKQLATDIDLNDPATIRHYNLTESIAESFASLGIGAIHALKSDAGYLQLIDDCGYLVYPWSEAVALEEGQVSEVHALKIAEILARMHAAEIDVGHMVAHEFVPLSDEMVHYHVQLANAKNSQHAWALTDALGAFLEIAGAQRRAIPLLEQHLVLSHGDLDQKNVLWDSAQRPLIIDWEGSRKLNPTYEIVTEALDWSGVVENFNHILCGKMLETYQQSGGVIEEHMLAASFDCLLGDWLSWLLYNVGRALSDEPEQQMLGNSQINLVFPTILRLNYLKPELFSAWGIEKATS